MRGWLLVRAGIAVVAVIAGWLLGVLSVLPRDWQGRAAIVALVIVFLLYVTAEYLHGVADRKETEAYRNHVSDLVSFAQQVRMTVERQSIQGAFPIDLGRPLGRAFRTHFPKVAAKIDTWNGVANSYRQTAQAFLDASNLEADRVGLGANAFRSVLNHLGNELYDLNDLTWLTEMGYLRIGRDPAHDDFFVVSAIPTTATETEALLLRAWDCICHFHEVPEVAAWITARRRSKELAPPLIDELSVVEITYDPDGRCTLCPK
jgi:hypothetical protein